MYRNMFGDLIAKKGKRITVNNKRIPIKTINIAELNLFKEIININNVIHKDVLFNMVCLNND